MLAIRLSRTGKKNSPSFRLVVADSKRAAKGKCLESIGHYNPIAKPKEFVANKEKLDMYMKNGAQLSLTAQNLLCDFGYLPKDQKIKKVFGKKPVVSEEDAAKAAKKAEAKIEESKDSETPAENVEEVVAEETTVSEPAEEVEVKETPETKEEVAIEEETKEEDSKSE